MGLPAISFKYVCRDKGLVHHRVMHTGPTRLCPIRSHYAGSGYKTVHTPAKWLVSHSELNQFALMILWAAQLNYFIHTQVSRGLEWQLAAQLAEVSSTHAQLAAQCRSYEEDPGNFRLGKSNIFCCMCPWAGFTGMKQVLPPVFRLSLKRTIVVRILKTYVCTKPQGYVNVKHASDTQITHSFECCTWRCPQHPDIVHQVGCLPCPVSKHITKTRRLLSINFYADEPWWIFLDCDLNSNHHLVFGFRFGIVGHFLYIVSWEEKLHLSAMVTFPPVASRMWRAMNVFVLCVFVCIWPC